MPSQRITQLPALPTNAALRLPLADVVIAALALATEQNVANNQSSIYQWWINGAVNFQGDEEDLKTAVSVTLNIPAGFRFYFEECYVVATTIAGLVSQPIVSFGNGADATKYVNALQLTQLTASHTRERIAVNGSDGETQVTARVDTIAAGTTFDGRFGFRGLLYPTA